MRQKQKLQIDETRIICIGFSAKKVVIYVEEELVEEAKELASIIINLTKTS